MAGGCGMERGEGGGDLHQRAEVHRRGPHDALCQERATRLASARARRGAMGRASSAMGRYACLLVALWLLVALL